MTEKRERKRRYSNLENLDGKEISSVFIAESKSRHGNLFHGSSDRIRPIVENLQHLIRKAYTILHSLYSTKQKKKKRKKTKFDVVIGIFLRVLRICSPEFLEPGVTYVINSFIKHKYPEGFLLNLKITAM